MIRGKVWSGGDMWRSVESDGDMWRCVWRVVVICGKVCGEWW